MRVTALMSGAMLLAMTGASAQAALTDGLVSYWPLDGGAVDQAAANAGNADTAADNGTIEGTPGAVSIGAGKWGNAGIFDGTDGYVSVAESDDVNAEGESLSISAWFRVDAFDKGWQALIAKGEGLNYRIARQGGDTNSMSYAGGATDLRDGPDVNDGLWHNIVATTEEGGLTAFYIDGVFVEDLSTRGDPGATASIVNERTPPALWIGDNPDANGRNWTGGIDDVAIWNRVLTVDEIAQIQQGPVGVPEPGAIALAIVGGLGLLGTARRRMKG
ncbi:MAG: LamG-like jellyroll fold domain-containing protein [Planctomycetota bacterium]